MSNNRIAAQDRTLEAGAYNRYEEWTSSDLEFVAAFADVSSEELAVALGRTQYGIDNVRHALRTGQPVGNGTGRTTKRPERTYTFIGDDVPDGW